MKKFIFSITIIVLAATAQAQTPATTFSIKMPVKILSWGSRSVDLLDGYWEMATPQLEKKLSKKLIDSIMDYSAEYIYPSVFRHSLQHNETKPDRNDLKMYLVATFDNNFNGSFHGVVNVVWIPMAENKKWGGEDSYWNNDVFLILPKEAVEVIKQ